MLRRDVRALALGSILVLGLYGARVIYSGHTTFGFILFNVLLALAPWGLSLAVARAHEAKMTATSLTLGAAWLLFLPNAPYILTDFLHLRTRAPVPLWYDVLLLGSAALLGLLAGAFSLARVQRLIARGHGRRWAHLFALVAIGLSGFGIYLGRFERLNSWDLLLHPFGVLMRCFHSVHPRAIVVTLGTAALFAVIYAGVAEPPQSPSPNRSRYR